MKSKLSQCTTRPGPSGSQAVPLLAEITATIATASSPCSGKSLHQRRPSPHSRSAMARRPHVSSISSLVHPHDTSQDSDDPEAQSGVLPDNATLLPATRRPVASRGIVDTRICRSLSSCNVNATPLQEQDHLDSDPTRDARQRQLRSLVRGALNHLLLCPASRRPCTYVQRAHRGFRPVACD